MASAEIPGARDMITLGLFKVAVELEDSLRRMQVFIEDWERTSLPEEDTDGNATTDRLDNGQQGCEREPQ